MGFAFQSFHLLHSCRHPVTEGHAFGICTSVKLPVLWAKAGNTHWRIYTGINWGAVLGSFQLSCQEGEQQLCCWHCPLPQGKVGSQKWPSPSATCHLSRKCHISEEAKLRSCSYLINTHIAGIQKSWVRNWSWAWSSNFFLCLLFVNICRNCSAQKCFQDWHWPFFLPGKTMLPERSSRV